jgi:hypothetical protein
MKSSIEDLIKRKEEAWSLKQNWYSLYEDAYRLAMPQRNLYNVYTPGQVKNDTVYDSTLQRLTKKLASTLQSAIIPPFTNWAHIIAGPFFKYKYEGISEEDAAIELEDTTETLFAFMQQSNFDISAGEFILDYLIGTGAMMVLPDKPPNLFKFIPVPIVEIAFEEGQDNLIGGIFRKHEKPARVLYAQWPKAKKIEELDKIIRDNPSRKIKIDEITYYDYDDNKWRYCVILHALIGKEPTKFYEESGRTSPWIISRWLKVAGEVFGRGPILDALPDAKTSNRAKYLELANMSMALSGVHLYRNNGIFNPNSIKFEPGTFIGVQNTGGNIGADIVRLDSGYNIQNSQIIQEQLQQAQRDAMFDQEIPTQGAVRSATEWILRQQKLQEAIGAPFARLHHEFIRPLFTRELDIMYEAGFLRDKIPIDGYTFDIVIVGTLAQAQALKDVESLNNWAQMSIGMMGQEAFMATAKVEDITRYLGNKLGVSVKLMRSKEEVAQIAANAAAVIQQQQQQQIEMAQGGEATEPIPEGEVIEELPIEEI